MSHFARIASILMVAMLLSMIPPIDANSSGKIGQSSSGCNCHNTDAMIVPSMTGLPSSYSPGATYTLTWSSSSMSTTGQGGFNLDASAGTWSNLGSLVKNLLGSSDHSIQQQCYNYHYCQGRSKVLPQDREWLLSHKPPTKIKSKTNTFSSTL